MKNNLKNMIAFFAFAFFATTIYAQPKHEPFHGDSTRVEALRVAFISERLHLTPQEAEKFWPLYNQYHSDCKALHQNFKPDPSGQLSADQQLDFEQKKLDLKKKYKPQFEGVLGKDKVSELYNLENEFRQKLKNIHDQRQQRGGQGGGNYPPHRGGY